MLVIVSLIVAVQNFAFFDPLRGEI